MSAKLNLTLGGGMSIGFRHDVYLFWLLALSLAYATIVYAYPMILDSDVFEAFDSFSYVGYLNENPAEARGAQRFLWLYPSMVFSPPVLHIYAAFLHFAFLLPIYFFSLQITDRTQLGRLLLGMCAAESVLFLGTASKEGFALVAVFGCLCAHLLIGDRKYTGALILLIYACCVGEISRPKFGILVSAGFVISLFPYISIAGRRLLFSAVLIAMASLAWYVLLGPGAEDFFDRYEAGQIFLAWFELELASTSPLKGAVREFFTLAFSADEPSLWFLVVVFLLSIIKAFVYLVAVPLISQPLFVLLPAQEWAICWQLAASLVTFMVLWGAYSTVVVGVVKKHHAAMLIFSFVLIYFLALSTFIFHVRYRAPGMVGLLATFLCMRKVPPALVLISSGGLCIFMFVFSSAWFV